MSEAQPAMSDGVTESAFHTNDMTNLYRTILLKLPEAGCRVIEVIAAQSGEGVSTVVRLLANAASRANARVLICDATPKRDSFRFFGVSSRVCLNDDKVDLKEAVTWSAAGLSLSCISTESDIAINIDRLDPVFTVLRKQFDLIVIDAEAISESALGLAITKKADRTVLIVEADRTRIPVVAAARRAIEASGGHLLGVVLNKRRFRIPGLIYRWL